MELKQRIQNGVKYGIKKGKNNVFVLYSILFTVFFICVFSPFWYYGKSFIWSMDGLTQHYSNLLYFKDWFSEIIDAFLATGNLTIPTWDMELGFGMDVLNALSFRPLNWLGLLWDTEHLESYFVFRSFISLYIAGIGFILFCKKHNNSKWATIIGTMIYVFCSYSLHFSAKHAFFIELMIYLPLLLLAVDKIMDEKKTNLFITIVTLCGMSYFYFLFIITIPAVIYALCKYLQKEKKSLKDFVTTVLWFGLYYLIGLGISAISFIPNFLIVMGSSRNSAEVAVNYFVYDFKYYLELLTAPMDYVQLGFFGFIGLSALAFLGICFLAKEKDKHARLVLLQLIIYFVCFLIPFISLVFNGFGGMSQRWSFIFSFWASYAVVITLSKLISIDTEKHRNVCIVFAIYLVIYIIAKSILQESFGSGILFLMVYLFISMVIKNLFGKNKKIKIYILLMVILCLELTMKSYELYAPYGNNYIKTFVNAGQVWDEKNNISADALTLVDDESVYRSDVIVHRFEKYKSRNYGVGLDIAGISTYSSYLSENVTNYVLDVGNSQLYMPFMIYDFDQRAGLNLLAGVKYATNSDSTITRLPYGYKNIGSMEKEYTDGTIENIYLYENQYALPLMYAYDSYISQENYEKMSSNEKEQAMLQAVVLEESTLPEIEPAFDYKVLLDTEEIIAQFESQISEDMPFEIEDGVLRTKKAGLVLKLEIPEGITGELYFKIDGVEYVYDKRLAEETQNLSVYDTKVTEANRWKAGATSESSIYTAMNDDVAGRGILLAGGSQYYYGERNLLENLGYCTTQNAIWVGFSKEGEYTFSDIQVISQPMENFADKVAKLKETPVTNISIDGNYVTGSINCDENKVVCVAIPYTDGWKAYIDGVEAELKPANGMYMAIEVPAGQHDIMLEYTTPGLEIGMVITIITIEVLALIVINKKFRKRLCKKKAA